MIRGFYIMYEIQTLNKISKVGLQEFTADYHCTDEAAAPDAILVRSAAMHDMTMPDSLLAIARAGAGVNNIPVDRCSEQGIVVFNTPGANANAVKELVIAGLMLASRKITDAIAWEKTLKGQGDALSKLVEKGKSAFVGPEILGKKLGVIGLGAIGVLVANAAQALGMTVYGYDPFMSVDAAWKLSRGIHHSLKLDEIYAECDYITVHVPLTPDTNKLICAKSLAAMKDGVRILNFARADLVSTPDIIDALHSGKVASYVTDFAEDALLDEPNVIAMPHLGASTPESEDNCAKMAAQELMDYLENGNIRNSVNLANVSLPRGGDERICVFHRNIPNMLAQISGYCSSHGINIENLQSASKKDYAYAIVDVTGSAGNAAEELSAIDGIIRVRVLH